MGIPTTTRDRPAFGARMARVVLVGVELFVAIGAVYGGVGLLAGNAIGMTPDWLEGTPFTTWTLPGIFLLLVVAMPMTLAAVLELRRSPLAYPAAVLAGAGLVGWIVAQWLIMQKYFFLQPTMLAAGVAVLLLAWYAHGAGFGG